MKKANVMKPELIYGDSANKLLFPELKGHLTMCLVTPSHPIFCNPMDCSRPGSSVHGDSPGKHTGVGHRALLREIFPPHGLNPCLMSPALAGGFFTSSATWEAQLLTTRSCTKHNFMRARHHWNRKHKLSKSSTVILSLSNPPHICNTFL